MIEQYHSRILADAVKRAQQGCLRTQCQLHLLDLKRAGHSPTKTEFYVPEGHTPARLDTTHEHGSASVAGWMVA